MNDTIREKDWKIVRELHEGALNTACDRILQRVANLVEMRGSENHKSYNELWTLMKEEDEQVALMFDGFKRSNAVFKLAVWKKNGLLSEEVFNSLTEETRKHIQRYNDL